MSRTPGWHIIAVIDGTEQHEGIAWSDHAAIVRGRQCWHDYACDITVIVRYNGKTLVTFWASPDYRSGEGA